MQCSAEQCSTLLACLLENAGAFQPLRRNRPGPSPRLAHAPCFPGPPPRVVVPTAQVLDENERSIRNATVHLYTTLFSRPTPPPTGFPLLQRAKRWHPFPARTYFSTWRFRWWPLLAAAMPPSLRMAQVYHRQAAPAPPPLPVRRWAPTFEAPPGSVLGCTSGRLMAHWC